jgi:hypothetical protein
MLQTNWVAKQTTERLPPNATAASTSRSATPTPSHDLDDTANTLTMSIKSRANFFLYRVARIARLPSWVSPTHERRVSSHKVRRSIDGEIKPTGCAYQSRNRSRSPSNANLGTPVVHLAANFPLPSVPSAKPQTSTVVASKHRPNHSSGSRIKEPIKKS